MKNFESTITINKPAEVIFTFLADMNNHEQLMPKDDISEWRSTADEASFTIRNMIKLLLKIDERTPNSEIKIIPAEKPPFEMELKWTLTPVENGTEVLFVIAADLNMMMKMVASGPLQKLADDETANLLNLLN
ncbi:SRPBCC family protein [Mucilaginibacter sp. E4BP6]|uniref:SRPBCC family protein n=1 Tax=Mucilaginibacter sp. E4BP6 TaxID=2723089 RepID=UPI0015CE23B6|nr:SRPBCC family protein [Mucilaginibacter sp. E4BP6]NYE66131.1 carbon monoxide dehydrogenase subunit G [Mucilaginibacter sp. E4BP6]